MSKFGYDIDPSCKSPSTAWVIGNERLVVPITLDNRLPVVSKLKTLFAPIIAHNAVTAVFESGKFNDNTTEKAHISRAIMHTNAQVTEQLWHTHNVYQEAGFIAADFENKMHHLLRPLIQPALSWVIDEIEKNSNDYPDKGSYPYDYSTNLQFVFEMLNWTNFSPKYFTITRDEMLIPATGYPNTYFP